MSICSKMRALKAIAIVLAIGLCGQAKAAVFSVTVISDNGVGSLRQAILDSNLNPGADTIQFNLGPIGSPPLFINLMTALPGITGDVTIIGPGSDLVIIQRDPGTNPGPFSIFTIVGSPTVDIRGLAVTSGGAADGGAINAAAGSLTVNGCLLFQNNASNSGGAISMNGAGNCTLNLINTSIFANNATNLGGGVALIRTSGIATVNLTGATLARNTANGAGVGHAGGGLFIAGGVGPHVVNITASTINDNSISSDGMGGGASVDAEGGMLKLINSTISGNISGEGSALAYQNAVTSLLNCTLVSNNSTTSATEGCILDVNNAGVSVKNTIISGNFAAGGFRDLAPAQLASGNNNLIGVGGPFVNAVAGNIVGVTNPRLVPMNTNGGPTMTFALQPDSPALDAASNADAPATDQRGQMRPSDGDNNGIAVSDIGAFETQRYLVTTVMNSGLGSLRQAILDNNTAGGGFIKFAIPMIGQQKTIFPKSPLPVIVRTAVIDGWSQGGQTYQGPPIVEIDGALVSDTIGLDIQWSDCIVRGLAINNFSGLGGNGVGIKISSRSGLRNWINGCYVGVGLNGFTNKGNGQFGIWIATSANQNIIGTNADNINDANERNVISGSTHDGLKTGVYIESNSNTLAGNNIGTDVTGMVAVPNFNGVWVVSGSTNQIGTSAFSANQAGERNIIAGNTNAGIAFTSQGANNFVSGNYIGVNAAGTSALSNLIGIYLDNVNRTLIGGTSVGERNIISGSLQQGLIISGAGAFNNLVQGNHIGTNAAGTAALGNGFGGILVRSGAIFNRIGAFGGGNSLDAARRNVISGNGGAGVTVSDQASTDNRVLGNYIGVGVDGLISLGNFDAGVAIINSPSNLIGGTTSGRNIISRQTSAAVGNGVLITGNGSIGNKVQNNLIGVAIDGSAAGNVASGVTISAGASANLVGGTNVGEGNVIANSGGPGVRVLGDTSLANAIIGNSIVSNAALGIDLKDNGVTPNGPANVVRTGPNNLQNYPVIASVGTDGLITASLESKGDTFYRVEFFSNISADPSNFGEGMTYLGFKNVLTNPLGLTGSFLFSAAVPTGENFISATATELAPADDDFRGFPTQPGMPLGTSEFAEIKPLNTPPTTADQMLTTAEDTDLTITLTATDPDPGTVLTFRISMLPGMGQLLQFGTLTPITTAGTVVTDPAGRIVFRPTANQFGPMYAIFDYIANDGSFDSNESMIIVEVTPVPDTPSVTDSTTQEDVQTTTGLVISRNPVDGPEVANFKITAITNGTLFQNNGTTPIVNGQFITFAQGNAGLKFTPAPNFVGTGTFNVQASLNSTDAGIGGSTVTAHIIVSPVGDQPSVTNTSTPEDTQSTSGLVITRNSNDGPEVTHFKIFGITNGSLFLNNGTTAVPDGSFITAAQGNAGLKYTPNPNFFGVGNFQVRSSLSALDSGVGGPAALATINVTPVPDTPSVTDSTTQEDVQTTTGLVISRNPVDSTEVTHFKITAITNGTLFQNNGTTPILSGDFITFAQGNAGLKFTPTPNFVGTGTFNVQASLNNTDAGIGGGTATAHIVISAVADTPTVTDSTTQEDVQTTTGLVISRNTNDGPEVTHFKITAITNGALFQNNGTTPILNGAFITVAQGNAGLKFTPSPNFFGNGSFNIQASLSNADTGLGGGTITAHITVTPVADTPSVTDSTTQEDVQTTTGLVISRNPVDSTEVTHFKITAITSGTLFLNDGVTPVVNGAFVTFAQGNAGLKFTPAPNFVGTGTFDVQASIGNTDTGIGGGTVTAHIIVSPVGDQPSVTDTSTPEDTQSTSGLVITRNSNDGQEVTHFKILGITNGSLFLNDGTTAVPNNSFITVAQGNAGLKYTPNPNFFGIGNFQARSSIGAIDAGVGGKPALATITVTPVPDTPSVTDSTTQEDVQTTTGLVISRNPVDSTEVTHFKITAITNGTLFQNNGTTPILNGDFITFAQGNAGLKFTPAPNFVGTGTFNVQASLNNTDAGIGGGTATAHIIITAVADTPSVTNATTLEDTQSTSGLVITRNPADGPEVTHFRITALTTGQLFQNDGTTPIVMGSFITVAQGNAGLKYTPPADFNGPVTFQVQASTSNVVSGLGGSVITATITVIPVNDPPSFIAANPPSVLEDSGAAVVNGWAHNFNPGPPDEASQAIVGYTVSGVTNAALFSAQPTVDNLGVLRYTPAPNANGTSQFTVRVQDSGGTLNGGIDTSAPQTFTITVTPVNDPPTFAAANPPPVLEDSGPATVINWATGFNPGPPDEAGQTNLGYTVSGVTNASLFSAQPTVDLTGALHYTPALNANGTSQFTVVVRDSGGVLNGGNDTSPPQTFIITVTAVNDAPSFIAADPPPVLEDSGPATVIGWAHNFNPGPPDESSQTILGYTVSGVTNASLFITPPTVDLAGVLHYTPAPNANGTSQFTVVVQDSGGTLNGGVDTSAPQTFTITVVPVNDPPTYIAADPPPVLEDSGAATVNNWAHDFSPGPSNESTQVVLGYFVSGVSNPSLFSAPPTVDVGGEIRYTNAPNANGTSQFTVVVRDNGGVLNGGNDTSGPQTFAITVTPVNDPPSFIAANPPSVLEDSGPALVSAWAHNFNPGPPDESAQTVLGYTVSGVSNPGLFLVPPSVSITGDLTYTPASNASGTSQFTVVVQDSGGTLNGGIDTSIPQTFIITVINVNDPPTFVASNPPPVLEDSGPATVNNWATGFNPGPPDEAGQTIAAYVVSGVSTPSLFSMQPTVDTAGTLRYTPAPNANGTSQFTVVVRDSGGTLNGGIDTSAPQTFTITVIAVNDPPTFVAVDPPAVLEDSGAATVAAWANNFNPGPPDESGQMVLGYTVSGVTNPTLFLVQPTVDNAGVLRYTPAPDAFGSSQFTVVVQDDGGVLNGGVDTSSPRTFTITVLPVNDPPTFTANAPPAVLEGTGPHTVAPFIASFNPGPANESTQTLSNILVDQISNPSLFVVPPAVSLTGQLNYTLASSGYGICTFRVSVRDSGGTANGGIDTSNPQIFTIIVRPAAVCINVTLDARTNCIPLTVLPNQINGTPSDPGPGATQTITFSRPLNVPFPLGNTNVIVTATYSDGLVSSCSARVTVLFTDCNLNGVPDSCEFFLGALHDCNNDGIPDECQCLWNNGSVPGADAPTANGQLSQYGSGQIINKAADDFYLCPNQVYRIFGFTGQMITNSFFHKAVLEFYEDCDGVPASTPFKTFINPTEIASVPASAGFQMVTYSFDLCSECFFLDGGKSYWVSLVGVTDNSGVDLSYWVTTRNVADPQHVMGVAPVKRQGFGGQPPYPQSYQPWQSAAQCCEGCVNLAWNLMGEGCLCAWDNGTIDLGTAGPAPTAGGSLSDSNVTQPFLPRTADNFIARSCDPVEICYLETYIWTNCNPVHGFADLFQDNCTFPGFSPILSAVATKVERIAGATLSYQGLTLFAYKLTFCNPGWVLDGSKTYWLSSGAVTNGAAGARSLFAYAAPRCTDPACNTTKISSGRFLDNTLSPVAWVDTGHEFAFRFAVRGSLGLQVSGNPGPSAPTCPADFNHDGAVSVQDIFAYLSSWFVGCP